MFIYPDNEDDIDDLVSKLKYIFGIHEIVIAYMSEDESLDNIKSISLLVMNELSFNTFKVETRRSDKSYNINSNNTVNI